MKIIIPILILILAIGCAKETPETKIITKVSYGNLYFTGDNVELCAGQSVLFKILSLDESIIPEDGYVVKTVWSNGKLRLVIYVGSETWDETNYYKPKIHVCE
jgi:hypothetical protein